jgi:tRNA-uridine 2-sulfurtransferase
LAFDIGFIMKIIVGLSGGVDSSVTAAMLKEKGHEVTGVTMKIWDGSFVSTGNKSACFGQDEAKDIEDIRKLCEKIDIPFYEIDLAGEYKQIVLEYFKNEYHEGKTPNPCVICNSKLKFRLLVDRALKLGLDYDYFATGHYARIEFDKTSGRFVIRKSLDLKKDQSYFLSFLTQEQISKVMFPLGGMTKDEVRAVARNLGLHVHDKIESQDFYSGDKKDLLGDMKPGDIVDADGNILGRHEGIANYTIGQRKGLGVSGGMPLYVVRIDTAGNRIVLGGEKDLFNVRFKARNVNWISMDKPSGEFQAEVKIRYRHAGEKAKVTHIGNSDYLVEFKSPQKSITPGQIAVFYDNDILLGGGIIEAEA